MLRTYDELPIGEWRTGDWVSTAPWARATAKFHRGDAEAPGPYTPPSEFARVVGPTHVSDDGSGKYDDPRILLRFSCGHTKVFAPCWVKQVPALVQLALSGATEE